MAAQCHENSVLQNVKNNGCPPYDGGSRDVQEFTVKTDSRQFSTCFIELQQWLNEVSKASETSVICWTNIVLEIFAACNGSRCASRFASCSLTQGDACELQWCQHLLVLKMNHLHMLWTVISSMFSLEQTLTVASPNTNCNACRLL